MAQEPRNTIKAYFETGDIPTQAQFGNLIDSAIWYEDFNANTILVANVDNTPTPITISANQVVGRKGSTFQGVNFEDVMVLDSSYEDIGFNYTEKSYTYADIDTIDYPAKYVIVIDNMQKYLGEVEDEAALVIALNNLNLGEFEVDGTDLNYIGYHLCGDFYSVSQTDPTVSMLSIDTTDAVPMLNIYGSTAFDLSIENTMVGNTPLLDGIDDLNLGFLAFPSGAVINWWHADGTDGWGSIEADALARGLDYSEVQGGDLYNGGLPYGRSFQDEYLYLIDEVGVLKAVVGVNITFPLIPFSGALIDWGAVDYDALKDEIDLIVSNVASTGADLYILELGMELITNSFEDLTLNPGGEETTKAQVIRKLLTYTDPIINPTSIMEHIASVAPTALVSIDGRLWDDNTPHDNDWIPVLSAIEGVHVVRQYYQFKDAQALTYEAVRAKVADRTDFWAFVENGDFNGKGVFISQMTVKATSPVRNTVANGLLIAEMYMVMTSDNLDHSNKLVGLCHMNLKQLFDVGGGYTLKVHYPFMKQMGEFFDDDQEWVDITASLNIVNESLVFRAIKVGSEIRIAILNPTDTAFEIAAIEVDGVDEPTFSVDQNYSTDSSNPLTTGVTHVTESSLNCRPYSLSIVTIS